MFKTIICFFLVLVGLLLFPFAFISGFFYFIGLRKLTKLCIFRLAQGWAKVMILAVGCKMIVKGRENIPAKGGVCFVSNHCGYFDIILALSYCKRPFGFIAKKELLFLPFFNLWIFMLDGLFIDRKNNRKAIKTINKGVERIKNGACMIIFPEGHRSKGRGLLPFHPGSLRLATKADAPIIPVAISGSYEIFERQNYVVAGEVRISFLEPIETANLSPEEKKQALCDKIYSVISEELSEKKL